MLFNIIQQGCQNAFNLPDSTLLNGLELDAIGRSRWDSWTQVQTRESECLLSLSLRRCLLAFNANLSASSSTANSVRHIELSSGTGDQSLEALRLCKWSHAFAYLTCEHPCAYTNADAYVCVVRVTQDLPLRRYNWRRLFIKVFSCASWNKKVLYFPTSSFAVNQY